MEIFRRIAFVVAIILPFWNIPLIVRVIRRRSSEDISLFWALGVWVCILLMAPASFTSKDTIFRVFSIINFFFFSSVVAVVLLFRKKHS